MPWARNTRGRWNVVGVMDGMHSASRFLSIAALVAVIAAVPVQAAPRPAPAFEIELLTGKMFRLADYKGTAAVVLLFWAPW